LAKSQPLGELQVGLRSDKGLRRENNEDWLGTFRHEDPEVLARKGSLFLVADGMGGHRLGDVASKQAVDQIIRRYVNDPHARVDASLRRAIERANAQLYAATAKEGSAGRQRRGTTIVAAVVRGDRLWIANVGDSRAYLQRNGRLDLLSTDHSWAAEMEVDPSEEWIGSHLITRALGLQPTVEVALAHPRRLRPGDQILLCSDGLTSPVRDAEINKIMLRYLRHPPQRAADELVAAANRNGGPDNVSAIVIRVIGVPRPGPEPAEAETPRLLERLSQPNTWSDWMYELGELMPVEDERLRRLVPILALALIALGLIVLLVLCALLVGQGSHPIELPKPR
jgi:serine/threonine protein phosphatase PrpC